MTTPFHICLIDDHELLRESLAGLIDAQSDMEVIGQGADGFSALRLARDLHPDLILMDISMPVCDGLESTRLILKEMPNTRILILTVHEQEEKLFAAIKAGACGYLLKKTGSTDFLRWMRGVLNGEVIIQPGLAQKLLTEFARMANYTERSSNDENEYHLTARERDVLELIAHNETNDSIAETLSVSVHTVKSHVSSILHKLQVANRQQAGDLAVRKGLLKPK